MKTITRRVDDSPNRSHMLPLVKKKKKSLFVDPESISSSASVRVCQPRYPSITCAQMTETRRWCVYCAQTHQTDHSIHWQRNNGGGAQQWRDQGPGAYVQKGGVTRLSSLTFRCMQEWNDQWNVRCSTLTTWMAGSGGCSGVQSAVANGQNCFLFFGATEV